MSVVRLDDVASELALHGPFVLKADVEGAELEVLAGATQVLAPDLRLAFINVDVGDLIEAEQLSGRRAHLQRLHFVERSAHVRRKDHAHFDQTILLQD